MTALGVASPVGTIADWFLELFVQEGEVERRLLLRGADDYEAEIDASLPGRLEAGAYSFVLGGLSSTDHATLSAAWNQQPVYARLYLGWRENRAGAGLGASLGSLQGAIPGDAGVLAPPQPRVAELRVTRFGRRAGARHYVGVLECHERVYEALRAPVDAIKGTATCLETALKVAQFLKVSSRALPLPGGSDQPEPNRHWSVPRGTTGLAALGRLAARMELMEQRHGRGMLLIRDGLLYIGPGRPIPLSGEVLSLEPSTGLVHVELTGTRETDPDRLPEPAEAPETPSRRNTYQLVLLGRPDLKPGDVVRVEVPLESNATSVAGLAGAAVPGMPGAPSRSALLYVSGVRHRLSPSAGFTTVVGGVEIAGVDEQAWEKPTPSSRPVGLEEDPSASPEARVASTLRRLARDGGGEPLRVGEVRASHVTGSQEPPGQTVSVWRGLAPSDGLPRQARRLPIDRDEQLPLGGVPYVTPFAWGKAGLVLPRYPGTRVLLGHAQGQEDDPVDLGALWESGQGPDSQAGDWWLILPAGVPPAQRQSLRDDEVPQAPTGKATNELIDADGNRIIEVGTLTIRIGQSTLNAAGQRPASGSEPVTIEHEKGSRIVIQQNGDIVISSVGALTLSAASLLTLEANKVEVKVKDVMEVMEP